MIVEECLTDILAELETRPKELDLGHIVHDLTLPTYILLPDRTIDLNREILQDPPWTVSNHFESALDPLIYKS